MNKLSCLIVIFFACRICEAQNLVPNASFENYDTCPDAEAQIERAIGWLNFGGTLQAPSTPDYYNACNAGIWNVPNGGQAHQYAYNGNAYAAVVTFASLYREYIGIELSQTLIIGQKYFMSLQTCMAEALGMGCPSNKIGMRLSTVPYSWPNPLTPDNFAHVFTDSIINDSINWNLIHGSFIADSAYQYLIIGNFFDDSNIDTIRFNTNSQYSYYLVDDVCVSTDSLTCYTTVGINEINENTTVNIFPNPANDFITVHYNITSSKEITLSLFNIYGQKLKTIYNARQPAGDHEQKMELKDVDAGIYFVKLSGGGKEEVRKVVKY